MHRLILFSLTGLLICAGAEARPADSSMRKADAFFYAGATALRQARYAEAYELLDYAYRMDTASAASRYELSRLYLATGDETRALKMMEAAYRLEPLNRYYASTLATAYGNLGRYEASKEIFLKLTKAYPEDDTYKYNLAATYFYTEDTDKGMAVYDRMAAETDDPDKVAAIADTKVQAYRSFGRNNEALAVYRNLCKRFPNKSDYMLRLVGALFDADKIDQAKQEIDKLGAVDSSAYRIALATYYSQTGKPEEAFRVMRQLADNPEIDPINKMDLLERLVWSDTGEDGHPTDIYNPLLEKLADAHPGNIDMQSAYARILAEQGNSTAAIVLMQRILKIEPQNTAAREFILADALERGDSAAVRRICRESRVYIADRALFYFYDAVVAHEQGKIEEAKAILQEAVGKVDEKADAPGLSDIYSILGDIYYEEKKTTEAFRAFDRGLQLNPNNTGILNNYAYYLAERGEQLDKAEQFAGRCVQLQPQEPHALDTYAYVYYMKGNYTMARIYVEKAIDLGKDAPRAVYYEHLGNILFKIGETAEAEAAYRQAEAVEANGKQTTGTEK